MENKNGGRRYRIMPDTKDDYIKLAEELCYPKECIEELSKSTSNVKSEQILAKYRKRT